MAWPGASATMTDAEFSAHLSQFLDDTKAARRLTCISRSKVPEDLAFGERAAEWTGESDTVAELQACSSRKLTSLQL